MDCRSFSGLTLLELLTGVVVASVITLVAVPAFVDLTRTNKLNSQTHLFLSALNYARIAAIEHRRNVYVCVRSDNSCGNTHGWENGWVIYVDENRNERVDAGEVVRIFQALESGYRLRPNVPVSSLLFTPNGDVLRSSRALPMMTFRMCSPDASDGYLLERSREIVLNATGRMRLQFGREIAGAC